MFSKFHHLLPRLTISHVLQCVSPIESVQFGKERRRTAANMETGWPSLFLAMPGRVLLQFNMSGSPVDLLISAGSREQQDMTASTSSTVHSGCLIIFSPNMGSDEIVIALLEG